MPAFKPLSALFGSFALLHVSAIAIAASPADAPPPPESRIAQVKVYPGSATVERVAQVAAGSRSFVFHCLPAGLDAQSLQVSGGASVRVGETAVEVAPRAQSAECAVSPLDEKIRALEDQRATLQAESDALALVNGYLKGLGNAGGDESGAGSRAPADPARLAAVAQAMRQTGQEAFARQHEITRRQEDIDRSLAPLVAERNRSQGGGANGNAGGKVASVKVTLDAPQAGELQLTYQIAGPGWSPNYRALLDTDARTLRIERLALVAQATGEDWRGVKLTLSTGQPRRATSGQTPSPWRIGIEPPPQPAQAQGRAQFKSADRAMMAPPAPMASMEAAPAPSFEPIQVDGAFATEFALPQPVDVPSSGERVSVKLGQHDENKVALAVRASPAVEPTAYLIAEFDPPQGVWPAGALQLYRDGAFVGNGRWAAKAEARTTLSFGPDERVRIEAEPEQDNQGTGGIIGQRAERRVQRGYVVENRHTTPVAVQLLEAAPVSVDQKVEVSAKFSPQPAELAWNKQPGVAIWKFDLGAGKTSRVTADYTIAYPKDAQLQMR